MAEKGVKGRIGSVKNIQKITRAMEMVAAARLRRAEQRISALRPYAGAIRRMTRQAAEAAGSLPNVPILEERESQSTVAILLVTGIAASRAPSTRRSSAPGCAPARSSRRTARRSSTTPPGAAGPRL